MAGLSLWETHILVHRYDGWPTASSTRRAAVVAEIRRTRALPEGINVVELVDQVYDQLPSELLDGCSEDELRDILVDRCTACTVEEWTRQFRHHRSRNEAVEYLARKLLQINTRFGVVQALSLMTRRQREAALLLYVANLSEAQICQITGQSPWRVHRNLVAARRIQRKLRDAGGRGGATPDA